MKSCRYLILAAFVLAALLGLVISSGMHDGLLAQDQPECTVTLQPGESIQAAINRAEEDAVICLAEGTWEENIKIEKSLILRGSGEEQTMLENPDIHGVEVLHPRIWIIGREAAQAVLVRIESLRITGEPFVQWCDADLKLCPHGMLIHGSAKVQVGKCRISGNGRDGINLSESTRIMINGTTISGNGDSGVRLSDSAEALVSESTIDENRGGGFSLHDYARADISNTHISENAEYGMHVIDLAEAKLTNCAISSNDIGIHLTDSARTAITNSIISGNKLNGVHLSGTTRATITGNEFDSNGSCGIFSHSQGEVRGEGNQMTNNGADLCGNLPGTLRIPMKEATEEPVAQTLALELDWE